MSHASEIGVDKKRGWLCEAGRKKSGLSFEEKRSSRRVKLRIIGSTHAVRQRQLITKGNVRTRVCAFVGEPGKFEAAHERDSD